MKRKLIFILGAGAIVMAVTAWLLYPRPPQPGSAHYRFMHCPQCELELPYDASKVDRPCPRCGREPHLIPTTASVAALGGSSGPFARVYGGLLLELNILLAVILYV